MLIILFVGFFVEFSVVWFLCGLFVDVGVLCLVVEVVVVVFVLVIVMFFLMVVVVFNGLVNVCLRLMGV